MIACCSVFNVWPKTTLLLPLWPRDAKRLDTPEKKMIFFSSELVFSPILVPRLSVLIQTLYLPVLAALFLARGCFEC